MESVKVLLWLEPVYTVSWSSPLGVESLENEVEPPYARSRLLPEDTAENVELTPLPHVSAPLETPHEPLDVDIVKLLVVPENVYVASVWTDHVPLVSSPPVVLETIVPLEGSVPEPCIAKGESFLEVLPGDTTLSHLHQWANFRSGRKAYRKQKKYWRMRHLRYSRRWWWWWWTSQT